MKRVNRPFRLLNFRESLINFSWNKRLFMICINRNVYSIESYVVKKQNCIYMRPFGNNFRANSLHLISVFLQGKNTLIRCKELKCLQNVLISSKRLLESYLTILKTCPHHVMKISQRDNTFYLTCILHFDRQQKQITVHGICCT